MKRFIWILLVIAAVAQPLSKTGIYMLFQANRAYIATHLCEKRAEPDSECQGKCYLSKKLKKDGEKQQQAPQTQKQVITDIIPAVASYKIERVVLELPIKEFSTRYQIKAYATHTFSIFHPPKSMA